jgi:integrase
VAYVRDTWKRINPDTGKKVRSSRYGKGKRWQAVWTEGGREVTRAFASYDAAEAFLSKTRVEQSDGSYVPKANRGVTVAEMWAVWIATKASTSKPTREGYSAAWKHIERRWGSASCSEISRADVTAWLPTLTSRYLDAAGNRRPLSDSSARKVMIVFHGVLDTAVEERIIKANPLRLKDAPKQRPSERRYLTVAELDRLRETMPGPAEALVVDVLVRTGLRPGEAFGLRVGDLDAARGRLRISRDVDATGGVDDTKTRRHRDVPAGGELLLDLEDAADGRDRGEPLLRDRAGQAWTRTTWRPVWEAARAAAGLDDVDTYELRHTAASLAIHSGANVKTIQRMLGHRSAAVTLDIYGHLFDDELDMLPAAMDAHMRAERERFAQRRDRARDRGLRVVPTEHTPSKEA